MSTLIYHIVETEGQVKGMNVNILRNASGSDSSLGGISSRASSLRLVGVNADGTAFAPISDVNNVPDEDYLVITRRLLFGEIVVTAHPKSVLDSGKWAMFGGNFCFSSDSRFAELNNGAPIKIFDRVEESKIRGESTMTV